MFCNYNDNDNNPAFRIKKKSFGGRVTIKTKQNKTKKKKKKKKKEKKPPLSYYSFLFSNRVQEGFLSFVKKSWRFVLKKNPRNNPHLGGRVTKEKNTSSDLLFISFFQ